MGAAPDLLLRRGVYLEPSVRLKRISSRSRGLMGGTILTQGLAARVDKGENSTVSAAEFYADLLGLSPHSDGSANNMLASLVIK